MLEIERGSTTSHCVGNSLWNRLWASRKTEYETNEFMTDCRWTEILHETGQFAVCYINKKEDM